MKRCIPLKPKSLQGLKRLLKKVPKEVELVEIWIDKIADHDIRAIKKIVKRKAIYLCRTREDGGTFEGTWREIAMFYQEMIRSRVTYIDMSINMPKELLGEVLSTKKKNNSGTVVIISYHQFSGLCSRKKIDTVIKKLFAAGADIAKVVIQVNFEQENMTLLSLLDRWKKKKKKLILHGMGKRGKWGRLAAAMLGSEISYVALSCKNKSAPGQWTLEEWDTLL